MKRMFTVSFVTLALMCMFATVASAVVVYDEVADSYYSTDEADGAIYLSAGYEGSQDKPSDTSLLLNNLVPTDETVPVSSIEPCYDAMGGIFYYTPENPYFVFSLRSQEIVTSDVYDVEIMDATTGAMLAAAYNIHDGVLYKIPFSSADTELKITVSAVQGMDLLVGSSVNKCAQQPPLDSERPAVMPLSETVDVPKNIDGHQGKIVATHTMSRGGYLYTSFSNASKGLTTVNIVYIADGVEQGVAAMNHDISKRYKWIGRLGASSKIDVRMSTNSTPGQITLTFSEGLI